MKKKMYIDVRTKSRKRQFMKGKKMAVNIKILHLTCRYLPTEIIGTVSCTDLTVPHGQNVS